MTEFREKTKLTVLPYSDEAERSVIGAIIIDNDGIVKIADSLSSDDFYDNKHKAIYEATLRLYARNTGIDVITLANELAASGELDAVGGAAYLTELTNYVPTAAHIEAYANLVAEKAVRRRLLLVNKSLSELTLDESKQLKELIEEAEQKFFEVSQRRVRTSTISLETILAESFDRLDDLHKDKNKLRGIPTGFRDLDNILAGLQRSDLFILAARPAMGKTAFVLNLAHNIAIQSQQSVLIFSLEMSKEQLVDRLLSMQSGVDAWALRTGNLTDTDFEKLSDAMGSLSQAQIFIDDTPAITIGDLRTKLRREAHQRQLGLVIIDYLQLMSGGGRFAGDANRVQEISEISRGLKSIARELNVPVVALSQLSRSVESRSPQIPQLADLRESGSIEQDADVVAFIYREDYYNPETDRKNITDIFIKKHRNGPTGGVELYFEREKQRFRSLDKKHSTPFDA